MNRRHFLQAAGCAVTLPFAAHGTELFAQKSPLPKRDVELRIAPMQLEIAPGIVIPTTAYNNQVPGPVLKMREGVPFHVDVVNASPNDDIVHWHGLAIDPLNDGAVEEGAPMIPAGATHRYSFTPHPSGTRWYHTHAMAMDNLSLGTYSGQFGFLLVEGKQPQPHYDQEFNLAVHHWQPSFVPMVAKMRAQSHNKPQTTGSDVGYKYATFNGHMLGHGEPIRVKKGQRILFRLLNASATENVVLALPGHRFHVIAMDGNPVPNPASVEVLSLAVAERLDVIVEMNSPGKWILGSTLGEERTMGLGVVIEYAGSSGEAVWRDPASSDWDYSLFASRQEVPEPAETFTLTFRDAGALNGSKFDTWTINGDAWPKVTPMKLQRSKRYRMLFRNASGDQHPMHLHRHSFEVTKIDDKPISGLIKDTINVMPLQTIAVDFIADNPGDTLLHCHQQLHMDYGFMQLFQYVG